MANLNCITSVLEKHMDNVEKSADSVKAYKYDLAGETYNRVWLAIELLYDKGGLRIEKILASTFMSPDGIPDQDKFQEKTKEFSQDPYVKKLLEAINADIKKNCK